MKKIFLFALLAGGFFNQIMAQCPMCKASVESSREMGSKSVGTGLNTGILLLLCSVYIIVLTVGVLWYRNFKRANISNG
ncbi:MAG: hypothetical protein V4613_14000 [Bacteroidota bacterium]